LTTRFAKVLLALCVSASVFAAPGSGKVATFSGKVCGLVTRAAEREAQVTAPCVQLRVRTGQTPLYVAQWGTPAVNDHFMTVEVGRAGVVVTKPVPILPRRPHWLGPITVAPGVSAYYTESLYHGVANGQGAIKFVEHGYQSQITLGNTSPALSGLIAVAKSVAARI
jgi:hypothetical protein